MAEEKIFLLHSDSVERSRLAHFLESSGFLIFKFARQNEMNDELRLRIPHLVIVRGDTKEYNITQVVRSIKSSHEFIPVLVLCPAVESEAERIFNQSGADSYLVQPIRKSNITAATRLLIDIRNLKTEISSLKDEIGRLKISLNRVQGSEPVTNFYNFEFFKKILSIELKRAQRYKFPLAIVVCAIDEYSRLREQIREPEFNSLILSISILIRENIRDLDIPVYYKEGHIMIVMPHTGMEGAVTLAERLRAKVAGYKPQNKEIRRVTLSVGVADRGEAENISFHDMCKKALSSLERAASEGGNRVAVPI